VYKRQALMGAILSTFNSVLNSAATLFATNVYKPFFGRDKSELQIVKSGKWFAIIVALIGLLASPFLMYTGTGLFTWLQMVNGFFNVPIFTIIFLGYVTKRVSAKAADIGLAFFVTLYALSQTVLSDQMAALGLHFLHVSAILFVLTSALILALGRLWPRATDYAIPETHLVDLHPWKYRYRMAGFVMGTMISMYVIFSTFGLASGRGLSPAATGTIVALIVVGVAVGVWADKKWPADQPSRLEGQDADDIEGVPLR